MRSRVGLVALGLVAAVVAALAIPFWLLWGVKGSDESEAFVSTPQFVVWLLVPLVQPVVWVAASSIVGETIWRRWRDLRQRDALNRDTVAAVAGSAAVLAVAPIVFLFGPRLGLFDSLNLASGSVFRP